MDDTQALMTGCPTYVSRIVPLPARAAPTVFEGWWAEFRRGYNGELVETFSVHDGEVTFDPSSWTRCGPGPLAPYRRIRGRLRARTLWRGSWPVEVELSPWSSTSSELGVRYAGRRLRGVASVTRYHRLAASVLEGLGSAILHTVPAELDERIRRPDAA
jgi:hypothetical protein